MSQVTVPFLFVNPKSYLWGEESLELARATDAIAEKYGVMIASGITTGENVYKVVVNGADGSGSTSGIVNAPSRAGRVEEMVQALLQAMKDRA